MKQEYTIGENVDGKTIQMTYFSPLKGNIDSAVLILPGGAYSGHADYEGEGYAQMFNMFGIHAVLPLVDIWQRFYVHIGKI